jgi:signal transduction histidine kinase
LVLGTNLEEKKMTSIKKRLRVNFTLLAVIMIIMFFGSTFLIVKKSFENYMIENQVKRNEEIVKSLTRELEKGNELSEDFLYRLESMAIDGSCILKICDENKVIIWDIQPMYPYMRGMHMMMNNSPRKLNYQEYEIVIDNNVVAYLNIGMYQSFFMTTEDMKFINSLLKGLILSAFISIIIAIIMSSYLSKKLARPIVSIKNTTNVIKGGDLTARNHIDSNISELKELSDSINELAINLSAQENLRIRLTRDVSHELRTPLHVMKSHVEALIDGIWEVTPERLKSINDEINRLSSLVKNLEKLANLSEEEAVEFKDVNISELIETVLMQYETIIEVNKIKLSANIQKGIVFNADEHKIKQVIYNLLSNAVKYTGEGGTVKVSLIEKNNSYIISVEDNGIGINTDEQKHVFERFFRTDKSRTSGTGGAGLGLSITKKIVEIHGGEIILESEENKGSKFSIYFPKK